MGDILFLAHRVPFPPDRGDKIRGYHLLQHLAKHARVHLAAFGDAPGDLDPHAGLAALGGEHALLWRGKRQAVAAVQALASRRPVSLTAFDDAAMHRAVTNLLARHPIDTIFVFSSQMAQYVPRETKARVIMDFVDMDSAKFAAYAADAKGPMAWMLAREARLLMAHEAAVATRADASLFVSAAEAELFRARTGAERVHVIENGIDTRHYDPAAAFAPVEAGEPLIVFTGQMDYRPNIEGVTWFAEAILPLVRAAQPNASFAIVGRNPSEAVRALARHPGVFVTGEVADVRGWLAHADAVVAPLRLARGIQNKVLEGMAMARPVVASAAAAEGIDHDGTIRVGADAAGIAAALIEVLANPWDAASLGAAARRRVVARYGWEARLAPLDALLGWQASAAA
ncbi:TIGR03087 family PEP-CTERM/XrtA system glycosyltransferase [Sphingomonas sp. MMS12-HWE2-04]|uniref:TIGR03087 family PEP-CTERM/XrtA system glycosyltransferase n=1 Tax=Sphingomonas sp. MMS12-HWE2-04 TaxID=3234199 RepID=UPI00384FF2DC